MAAPAPTVRQTPVGAMLTDGYQSLVTCALDPDISLWEKEVTPPGIEADEFQDVSTQQSVRWRTKGPRRLLTLGDLTFTAQYHPGVYTQIRAIAGVNTTWTVLFPDYSTIAFYGALKSFMPGGLSDGGIPEATVTITPTNLDPTTCTEEGFVYTAGGGTGAC
jgi:hypothetical protein